MWNQTCNPWMIHPMQQLATPMHITHKDYIRLKTISIYYKVAKGIVAELASLHSQSAWGSRGERVRTAGLAACCNYL